MEKDLIKKVEILAPAGNFEKLKTAIHFGANAVYLGGKNFSLRSFADNFDEEEMKQAVAYAHAHGVKAYVTVNIFAKEGDLQPAAAYFRFLEEIGADAVLVTDPGLMLIKNEVAPKLPLHVSTQANTLNSAAIRLYRKLGACRVVLARELSFTEIAEIRGKIPRDMELEAFVHGAMCISYSGRCLLSNYFTSRDANRGECVQACRFRYALTEEQSGLPLGVEEDKRGTYFLSGKDLCLAEYLKTLADAGVCSFKIEGRMKSEFYLATVVSAYRKAADVFAAGGTALPEEVFDLLDLAAHRPYTTAYALGDNAETVNYKTGGTDGAGVFLAVVKSAEKGRVTVEMRNRFFAGERVAALCGSPGFCRKTFVMPEMKNASGEVVTDARLVQELLTFDSPVPLSPGDILYRKK